MTDVQTTPDTGAAGEHDAGPGTQTRRAVLAGAGALGAGCLLAACGSTTTPGTGNPNGSDFQENPAPAGSRGAAADGATGNDPDTDGGAVLAAVGDVPEGGGIIKGNWVITQPASGTFKAFNKSCTHQGCAVNAVSGGLIRCPCHNSTFSIEDGSPQGGPAPKPLAEQKVKVQGDSIVAA